VRDFRRIKAWQRAHALSIALYKLTRGYRRAGFAQLRSQLTRAGGSISTNIVEGCGAPSNKEFARYLAMSIDSANETEYHLLVSRDLSLINDDDWRKYTAETIEVRKMVYGYREQVLSDEPGADDEHCPRTPKDDLDPPPLPPP
jgi:four helix bundle protein